jgi:hypothetical protein
MNIKINIINQIPNKVEQYIIKKINKKPPNCFGPISDEEIDFVKSKVKLKYDMNIDPHIIWSIKSAYMKDQIILTHFKLSKYKSKLIDDYRQKISIKRLSKKYGLSPMTIMRYILETKYLTKIKNIIADNLISDDFDKKQLDIATKSDIYNQIEQSEQSFEAAEFEKKIEQILSFHNIKFQTQEELTAEQIKLHGKAINTPDFLVKSDLIINNHQIKWIDAKNFYGSNVNFVKKKIQKQIIKYINTYGPGLIVFKHGFNSDLTFDQTLIMSIESVENINKN